MKTAKSNLFINGLVVLSLITPLLARATESEGGSDRGGGNYVGIMLLDFYEDKGTRPFIVKDSLQYKKYLKPILDQVKKKVPKFGHELESVMMNLKFVLDPKPIEEKGCINKSITRVAKGIAACQNRHDVRINANWFNRKTVSAVDEEARLLNTSGLIMHEVLRYRQMVSRNNITDEQINFMNRTLFKVGAIDENELSQLILEYGFGYYATATEVEEVKIELRKSVLPACDNPKVALQNFMAIVGDSNTKLKWYETTKFIQFESGIITFSWSEQAAQGEKLCVMLKGYL